MGKKKKPKRRELFEQLRNSITLRNQEHNTWLAATFLSLTTSALFLMALLRNGQLPDDPMLGVLITLFGAIVSLFLLIVQERALNTTRAYEEFSKKIDHKLDLEKYSYNKFRDNYLSKNRGIARFIIVLFNYCLLIGWIIFFIIFLIMEISCT